MLPESESENLKKNVLAPSTDLALGVIARATKAVPAVKFALGIAGVAAAAYIVGLFLGTSWVVVIVPMFIFMILLFVFSVMIASKSKSARFAGDVLIWIITLCFATAPILGISYVITGQPERVGPLLGISQYSPVHETSEPNGARPLAATKTSASQTPSAGTTWAKELLFVGDHMAISPFMGSDYFLAVHLTVKFKSEKYNTESYLRSLTDVSVPGAPDSGTKSLVSGKFDQNSARLRVDITLAYSQRPTIGILEIVLGPAAAKVGIPKLSWTVYELSERKWWEAELRADLVVDDPDWPILKDARIIPLQDKGGSYLEVLIENTSRKPSAITGIEFAAQEPKSANEKCYKADKWQSVILNWNSLVGDAQGQPAGWTSIDKRKVEISAHYRRGSCSMPTLVAVIPVVQTLDPSSSTRLQFELLDLPLALNTPATSKNEHGAGAPDKPSTLRFDSAVPRTVEFNEVRSPLHRWSRLVVSVQPNKSVYPSELIMRNTLNSSRLDDLLKTLDR